MRNLLCMMGFHQMPKWSAPVPATANARRTRWGQPVEDWHEVNLMMQERTCLQCGRYERRVLNTMGEEINA